MVVKKEYICILFVNAETFHLTISFFFRRGFSPALQDAEGIFSAIKKAFGDEGLEQYWKELFSEILMEQM